MLVCLSPAKTLTLDAAAASAAAGAPRFAAAADALAATLGKLPRAKLATVLDVSPSLAALNADRYAAWGPAASNPRYAAGWAYDGPAMKSLALRAQPASVVASADARVRIISGLYGLLKPTDAIQPYRLCFSCKLAGAGGVDSLYSHWGDRIAQALDEDLDGAEGKGQGRVVVNAASGEYWKAVANKLRPTTRVVTCIFPGPAVHAKAARGAMARFIAEEALDAPDRLKEFCGLAGEWAFDAGASDGDTLVFKRGAASKSAPKATKEPAATVKHGAGAAEHAHAAAKPSLKRARAAAKPSSKRARAGR